MLDIGTVRAHQLRVWNAPRQLLEPQGCVGSAEYHAFGCFLRPSWAANCPDAKTRPNHSSKTTRSAPWLMYTVPTRRHQHPVDFRAIQNKCYSASYSMLIYRYLGLRGEAHDWVTPRRPSPRLDRNRAGTCAVPGHPLGPIAGNGVHAGDAGSSNCPTFM